MPITPPERQREISQRFKLQPCLALRTRIVSVRNVAPGQGIGYGASFVSRRPLAIAVIALGFADGLVRARAKKGKVLLRGNEAPIVGFVSMDLTVIDVTGISNVRIGDIVTVYGIDGDANMSVSDVAAEVGTVPSDILCALGTRLPRFYLN
jgi:alanine racemase